MISPDLFETRYVPVDALQDQERARRAEGKVLDAPPLISSDSPAVQAALEAPERAIRWVGKLAVQEDTSVGKVAKTLLENNGALPKPILREVTGLPAEEIGHALDAFRGNFVVEKDIVVIDALHPKRQTLEPSGQIYPTSSDLAKAS